MTEPTTDVRTASNCTLKKFAPQFQNSDEELSNSVKTKYQGEWGQYDASSGAYVVGTEAYAAVRAAPEELGGRGRLHNKCNDWEPRNQLNARNYTRNT